MSTRRPRPMPAIARRGQRWSFVNGLGLEGWMTRLVEACGYPGSRSSPHRGITACEDRRRDPRPDGGDRSACLAVGGQCEDLCRQHSRRSRTRSTRPESDLSTPNAAAYLGKLDQLDTRSGRNACRASRPKAAKSSPPTTPSAISARLRRDVPLAGARFRPSLRLPRESWLGSLRRSGGQVHRNLFPERHRPAADREIARETGPRSASTLYSDALSPADGPGGHLHRDDAPQRARTDQGARRLTVRPNGFWAGAGSPI